MTETKSKNRLWGGIFLLTGTAIGGGLLALPIAMAETGFFNSLLLLIGCWLFMTASALIMLEVNLWLPDRTNIVSMSRTLLGPGGTIVAWVSYLLLLYSIVSAYMASGADFLQDILLKNFGWHCSYELCAIFFTVVLGSVVCQGIRWVDYLNRGLMLVKFGVYGLLIAFVFPHISISQLWDGDVRLVARGFPVIITAFSYGNIVPSLRTYFQEDIVGLRKAILIGSLIPLVCYLLWAASVMGVIPLGGSEGLIQLAYSSQATSGLMNQLTMCVQSKVFSTLAQGFGSVCVFTTFLTCSLGLVDFLADGLKLSHARSKGASSIVYTATFLPPLLVVFFCPGVFLKALNYAGIYCLVLLVLLPVMMAWRGRYQGIIQKPKGSYQLIGGKPVLGMIGTIAVVGIIYSLSLRA